MSVEILCELGDVVENDGERFIVLTDESRLPAKWSDEFKICSCGKAQILLTVCRQGKKEEVKYNGRFRLILVPLPVPMVP
jgi:hypothetical protein